jgi:hypothetical protein
MGYALVALVGSGGNLSLVNHLLLDRGLLSPAAHMAWTGLAAAALWRAATEHWRPRAVVRLVGVYLFVAALHAAWDSTVSVWAHAGLAVVSLGLLLRTAHRLARADRPLGGIRELARPGLGDGHGRPKTDGDVAPGGPVCRSGHAATVACAGHDTAGGP